MRAQLVRQQSTQAAKNYVLGLNDAQFLNLENRIENELVSYYDSTVIPTLDSTYIQAARNINLGVQTGNKQMVISALNQIISIFKASDPRIGGLIQETNNNQLSVIPAALSDLIGVSNIIAAVDRVIQGNGYNAQTINSILTPSGEAIAALSATIDSMAEDVSGEAIISQLQKAMKGTTRSYVAMEQNPNKTVENKATDIQFPQVKYRETVRRQGAEVLNDIELIVDPYATVKTYRSDRSNVVKMISYANRNSIAMDVLKDIYGDTDMSNYQLYNTIAFNGKGNSDLAQNFKIIRSDMVAELAEKYIIGYNDNTTAASQIMIHNFKAYPILVVLAAISQQAREATEKGELYSSSSSIFSIRFDAMYKIKNTWVGDTLSDASKYDRILQVKSAIDNISTRGYLNMAQFNKFITTHAIDGISLENIIPRISPTRVSS